MKRSILLALALLPGLAAAGHAKTLVVGATVSATGPAASLGIPEKNALELMPKSIDGTTVRYVILDDGGDPGHAVRNVHQLIEQYKADVIIGSTTIPNSIAIGDVALQTKTPQIALAPIPTNAFTFTLPQSAELMVQGLVDNMKAHHFKTVAYIGFADSLGDQNYAALKKLAGPAGLKVVADERYARNDTSVAAQVLKVMIAHPDAVFIGASGTPAALPQIGLVQRGYKGQTYFLHGVINGAFLRVGGKSLDGTIATAGPFAVAASLPADNPIKNEAMAFTKRYNAAYGAGSANTFAAYAWDAFELIKAALPGVIAKAEPGTAAFRADLRAALQSGKEVIGTDAVYRMTPTDHNGLDSRARVMVTVHNGAFHLLKK
jgi:branched-chain amino acid transport system substrate-binding protein